MHETEKVLGQTRTIGNGGPCPVCTSSYTLYVQDVVTQRTKTHVPQYYCMNCASFFNFGAYRENDAALRNDLEFLKTHATISGALLEQLAVELMGRCNTLRTACEVGCGIGQFVKALEHRGVQAKGYDLNPYAVDYARSAFAANCECAQIASDGEKYDLVAAIQVFEHLREPRALFADMRARVNPGGAIYVSVPFVTRDHWKYLWTASQRAADGPPDPFFDNDVHIVHFSVDGLIQMGRDFGAISADYFVSANPASPGSFAYPGVLFRF